MPPNGFFSYDGENFEKLPEKTTHMHGYTRMGNYNGDPFIVGNYWPQENAETEIMNHQTGQGSTENHLFCLQSVKTEVIGVNLRTLTYLAHSTL